MSRLLASLVLGCLGSAFAIADTDVTPLTAIDNRLSITVTARERNQVLYEMRTFLHGLHNIHLALSRKDLKAVALEAKALGQVLNRMPASMRDRMPEAFLEMSHGQYEIFDVIARDAEAKVDLSLTFSQLAEAMTYCSGCHDTYRFQIGRVEEKK